MSDGYTHEPETLDGDGPGVGGESGDAADPGSDPTTDEQGAHPDGVDREFDWRGWTLVAAIVVSFLVVPGVIYLYPHVGSALGLTFWDTYLALPMVPAILLGVLAVWATTRP